mgnify:CR=1 FL=1
MTVKVVYNVVEGSSITLTRTGKDEFTLTSEGIGLNIDENKIFEIRYDDTITIQLPSVVLPI